LGPGVGHDLLRVLCGEFVVRKNLPQRAQRNTENRDQFRLCRLVDVRVTLC
jgi:hypothetical protein